MRSKPTQLSLLLIIILGAISALTPFAIDMYLPAMPAIAQEFSVSAGDIQITLTAYMLGFAIGQLLHGPLADSFGRKPVLLIGTLLFTLASVLSAISPSIEMLTWMRVGQGFAGAAAAVVIQAIVRDMFDKEEFARTMSFIVLVMTLAPLIAPLLGGYMAVWFGWRSIFWVIALIALLVIVAITFKIPETLAVEKRQPFRVRSVLRNYRSLVVSRNAMLLILTGALSFAGMFAFLTAGSFIFVEIHGVDIQHVGYLFGLNVVSMMVMTVLNGRLVRAKGSQWMLKLGLTIQLVGATLLLLGQVFNFGLWGVVLPIMLYVSAISTVGSNSMAILLSDYPSIAGTASSLSGTLRFGLAGVAAAVISFLPAKSSWPMVGVICCCASLAFTCLLLRSTPKLESNASIV
ncbi:Bcr/CflA family drug resistance efflux transporter [Psychromonas sp. psych-6C06]|uniref:Bcr/CflA family multidrug efflux MFS transporter n=1 Tax=Psychromonas sp. psych-6C06 TaxID=2058089 RepID=UPI000C32B6CC|nr:Bcr/CflA family multidrug efflux MFS transporter [Psychromonas sp. psych-6C06]PKF60880.1 Bcr/CflA family drug resistance efflux transporter [Psychromonas sp. psych-6C06]